MAEVTAGDLVDESEEEEEEVQLTWSCAYIMLCLLLPTINGFMNGYSWSGLSLHYADMGWAVSRSGVPTAIGFLSRLLFQQIQMRWGFWSAIPLGLLHLATAIVGMIFPQEEWAVWLEVIFLQGLDPSITVEGLAFDKFGQSEKLARQASSTVLAVFTIAIALSVTIGGLIYDLGGWQAMSCYHVACQALFLFIILLQPAIYKSFREFWSKAEEELICEAVIPEPKVDVKVKELKVEEAEEMRIPGTIEEPETEPMEGERKVRMPQRSSEPAQRLSTKSQEATRISHLSHHSNATHGTRMTMRTGHSGQTCRTALTARSGRTKGTHVTGGTVLTRMTNLKDSEGFQYHFGANAALRPTIAQRAGEEKTEEKVEEKSKGVPKDLRGPLLLVVLCCFSNLGSYVTEFSTFAIFFKEYHGWNSAIWASLAQTSGDLLAAIMMKVLPNGMEDTEDVACWKRLLMQPYNLCCLLLMWVPCSAGMISPWLPLAISAQIVMGTVFVYVLKFYTDLNLFYSLGDTDLFLALQVWCKNAEAVAGCLFGFLGPYLFDTVSPFFPFVVSSCMGAVTFVLFTAGFFHRVGWLDIESAEAQRSRRLGTKRTSHWSVVSRKTQVFDEKDEA